MTVKETWYHRIANLGGVGARQKFDLFHGRLRASPIGYRLARGAFWALVATTVSRALALVTSVIAARVLGRETFGQLGVIQSTVQLFGTLAGLGLGLTATKYIAEFRRTDPPRAGRLMGLCLMVGLLSSIAISALAIAAAPWLASSTLAAPELAPLLRVGSLLILLGGLNGAQYGALAGFEAFKAVARITVLVGIVTCPLVVAGMLLWGVQGAVWGFVAANVVNCWLSQRALEKEASSAGITISLAGCFKEWRVLAGFSFPALIASALAAPVNWGCNAMLVNQPHGYAQMGVLNAVNQWYFAVLFLPGALLSNAMPVLSERQAIGDRAGLRKALALYLKASFIIVVPTFFLCSLVSRPLMGIYGAGFRDHWLTLIVSLATGALVAIQMPIGQIVVASGRMWLVTGAQLLWAILFCGGTWAAVSWGALGLVSARLAAYVVHTGVTSFLAWQQLKPPPPCANAPRH